MSPKLKQAASKREQAKKANSTVFIVTAIAAVLVMFSLTSMRFLWQKKSYNDRVVAAKSEARDQIDTNIENIDKLAEQFPQLEASATASSKTILHALPPVYDYAALASSIDRLASISGVRSDTGIGEDITATAINSSPSSQPVELPLTLRVTGSYEAAQRYIESLEKSIRPIHITGVKYSGTRTALEVSITAVTYYQPARSLDVLRSPLQ